MRVMRRTATLLTFGLAALAVSCSGPRTQEVILYNGATTVISAGLALTLTILAYMRQLPNARTLCLILLVIHPAWTMFNSCCDCGTTQMALAVLDGIISVAVFTWDSLRRRNL